MRETLTDPATGNAKQYGPGMPLMVAELSGNHGGDLNVAYELIDMANDCGFDAVKFQYFEPEHMASLWADIKWRGKTTSLRELYRRTQTPLDWFEDLFARVRTHGMLPIVSVFHPDSVALFEGNEALDPAAYKIASAECLWAELIAVCLDTRKTVIVSDGNKLGMQWDYNRQLINLRCVPKYPAQPHQYGFGDIARNSVWGVSDHTAECDTVSMTAAALGASVIEFHIMAPEVLNEDMEFSLTAAEAKRRIVNARAAAAIAQATPRVFEIPFARGWVAVEELAEGDEIHPGHNVEALRDDGALCLEEDIDQLVISKPVGKGRPVTKENVRRKLLP